MSAPSSAADAAPLQLWDLPADALSLVLQRLPLRARLSLRRACVAMRDALDADAVWAAPFAARWPGLPLAPSCPWRAAYQARALAVAACAFSDPTLLSLRPQAAGPADALCFAEAGALLLCGGGGGALTALRDGGECASLRGHSGRVLGLSAGGGAALSISADRTLRLWSMDGSFSPRVLRSHQAGLSCLAPPRRAGGALLAAAGCADGVVLLARSRLSSPRGDCAAELRGHGRRATALLWAQDDPGLLSCAQDGRVKLWDAEAGRLRASAPLRTPLGGGLRALLPPPARLGTALVLGERRLALLDLRAPPGAQLAAATPELQPAAAPLCAAGCGGARAATGHADGVVRVWDARRLPSAAGAAGLRTHPPLASVGGHSGAVTALAANGHAIASAAAAPRARRCGAAARGGGTLRLSRADGGGARALRLCGAGVGPAECEAGEGCRCAVRAVALCGGGVAAATAAGVVWRRFEQARAGLGEEEEEEGGFWQERLAEGTGVRPCSPGADAR